MSVDPRFRQLFEEEYERVFRSAYLLCRDRATAEDCAQEAFARCLERWDRLGGQPWVGGWVTSTALNLARRSLRRRKVGTLPDRTERDLDASVDLRRGIRGLPRRQQQAMVLYYGADLPIAEVAAVMRCEEGTVKAHLARAREALRGHLEGERVEG
ncbi:MAG: RNA polymerase sigma factor [Actinomycetota bacterium]